MKIGVNFKTEKVGTDFRIWYALLGFIFLLAVLFTSCHKDVPDPGWELDEEYSGGETTVFDASVNAFNNPAANLSGSRSSAFFIGNSFFRQNWVIAPSSTVGRDGLGPLFNARSCGGCHELDGRGRPPLSAGENFSSMLLRLSIPGSDIHGGTLPDPNYGGQFNQFSIPGVQPEGTPVVNYEEIAGQFADGETYSLRKPTYSFNQLNYGSLAGNVLISPRVAPVMCGLGLLEALDESTILANTDPLDANGDGVSGRANYVWNSELQKKQIGRFGWKANQPTLRQQTAGAFLGDLGITSSIFPDENCTSPQADCRNAINGGSPELSDTLLEQVTFYSHLLAVPARRDWKDATVVKGKTLFASLGCAACHLPKLQTGTLANFPEVSNQTIRPYTDLLLHDMGAGLADNRPDFEADGNEWRTPPLWGLSLVEKVNNHSFLLHDGRARNILEAVLWHGGEAQSSKDKFVQLSKIERDALIAFLRSL